MNIMKKVAAELLHLARNALEKAGANPVMAGAAARHLVRAEAQGLPSHGMSRVPFYCGVEVADELVATIEKLAA